MDHNIIIDAAWLPEQDDTVGAAETAWAREFLDALESHRAGVYVNFLDSDDGTSRVREAYGDANYRRLVEVKAKYDPENVFRTTRTSSPPRRRSERSPHQLVSRPRDATVHHPAWAQPRGRAALSSADAHVGGAKGF